MEARQDLALLEAGAQFKAIIENYHSLLNAACFCLPPPPLFFLKVRRTSKQAFSPLREMKGRKQNN